MTEIPKPSKEEVDKYIEKWKTLENYVNQENSLNKLFLDLLPENKEIDDRACLNRLMALEGAIQNIRWHNLSEEDKDNLRDFYNLQK